MTINPKEILPAEFTAAIAHYYGDCDLDTAANAFFRARVSPGPLPPKRRCHRSADQFAVRVKERFRKQPTTRPIFERGSAFAFD